MKKQKITLAIAILAVLTTALFTVPSALADSSSTASKG